MRYFQFVLLSVFLVLVSSASADYRELFEKEFLSKPWGVEITEESACLQCHTSDVMSANLRQIPQDWRMSWHYQNDVSCDDCHGGDSGDATMAMSHQRNFVGSPKYQDVPEFCGKCHIGILKNYVESGHGKALKATGKGPNCVTCHGAHNIQKVSIDIINPQLCSQCHSYDRAKEIKQALFLTENKIEKVEQELAQLRKRGVYPEDDEKRLFDTQAKFRVLFHTVDVSVINDRTYLFTKKLDDIDTVLKNTFTELNFRKKFSTFLALIFAALWIVVSRISRSDGE